ncbi:MAG: methyltransferase domain-containing protein [Bacteroidota bacterium]
MEVTSFRSVLGRLVAAASPGPPPLPPGACRTPGGAPCRLCHARSLSYEAEVILKDRALASFWNDAAADVPLAPLVRSPQGRGYRTVSKRKVSGSPPRIRLGLIDPSGGPDGASVDVVRCLIEPDAHAAIYAAASARLADPALLPLAGVIRYVIIRGSYEEFWVILSVGSLGGGVIRAANSLSRTLTRAVPAVRGVFLHTDTGNGRYYMGDGGEADPRGTRRIFGQADVFRRIAGWSFLSSPFCFSQVNQYLVETLAEGVRDLLRPSASSTLYDLYCGYGLFGLILARGYAGVVGVESSRPAVESAGANASRQGAGNIRFLRRDITGATTEKILHGASFRDHVLLDPPRGGTAPGVIEALAASAAGRVVHLFCAADLVADELHRWTENGFRPLRAIPYDMFPGTSEVEIAVLLERKR